MPLKVDDNGYIRKVLVENGGTTSEVARCLTDSSNEPCYAKCNLILCRSNGDIINSNDYKAWYKYPRDFATNSGNLLSNFTYNGNQVKQWRLEDKTKLNSLTSDQIPYVFYNNGNCNTRYWNSNSYNLKLYMGGGKIGELAAETLTAMLATGQATYLWGGYYSWSANRNYGLTLESGNVVEVANVKRMDCGAAVVEAYRAAARYAGISSDPWGGISNSTTAMMSYANSSSNWQREGSPSSFEKGQVILCETHGAIAIGNGNYVVDYYQGGESTGEVSEIHGAHNAGTGWFPDGYVVYTYVGEGSN